MGVEIGDQPQHRLLDIVSSQICQFNINEHILPILIKILQDFYVEIQHVLIFSDISSKDVTFVGVFLLLLEDGVRVGSGIEVVEILETADEGGSFGGDAHVEV